MGNGLLLFTPAFITRFIIDFMLKLVSDFPSDEGGWILKV